MKKLIKKLLGIPMLFVFMFNMTQMTFASEKAMVEYKIKYEIKNYSPYCYRDVTLHYGINGWNNIKDEKMTFKYENGNAWYEKNIKVNQNDVVDYCFKNYYPESKQEVWNNNSGQDYHIKIIKSNL